jgi:pimeloyl-ACP methyl ester carboxylesterase
MLAATARRVALPTLLALSVLLTAPHAAFALRWTGCPDFHGVLCSTLKVPLDRTGADPGTVPLRLARTGHTAGKTLMYLSGGPGGAGVSEMLSVISLVPELKQRYRVIGYDQRGTGASGLLRCPAIERDPHLRDTAAAEQCAVSLGAARRHYTTADSVQDMETIRQALGVDKLTLFGISYGTELALEYARTYPTHVAKLIIDSVVDPDDHDPFFTTGFRAMPTTLRALCPDHCRGISTDPATDLAALVKQLRVKSMTALAYDAHGTSHKIAIGPVAIYDLMFDADYDPALRAAIPAAVKSALAGDGAPLARLLREGHVFDDLGPPSDFSAARYATICEETPLPWDPGTPLDQRLAATRQRLAALAPDAFFPFDAPVVVEDEIDLCLRWPDVPRPAPAMPPPPYPAVPTLILQGAEDLRTPPEGSARVAALIPGVHRLVVPGVGHAIVGDDPSECGIRALLRFDAGQSVPASCPRVHTNVPGILYPPPTVAGLRGVGGLPRKVGRTVSAIAGTLADLDLVLSPAILEASGGGLRGGTWAVHGRRLTLHDYRAVAGVTLSGGGTSRVWDLRIGGASAARGSVTLRSGGRLVGRLGGRRIDLRLATSSAATATAATLAQEARVAVEKSPRGRFSRVSAPNPGESLAR